MIGPNIRLPTGLRGRLLLAFGRISSFATLAAVAGLVAFVSSRQALEDATARRVPETVGAMELLRLTERLVATGQALLNTTSADEISEPRLRRIPNCKRYAASSARCSRSTVRRRH
jgi:hypothetical protein